LFYFDGGIVVLVCSLTIC